MGNRIGIYALLYSLALVAPARGDDTESAGLFGEALRLSVEMGDRGNVAYCLEGLAGIVVTERKLEQAASLWGAAEPLLDGTEAVLYVHTPDRAVHAQAVAAARTRLDPVIWGNAWNNGRTMSLGQAVIYALGRNTSG